MPRTRPWDVSDELWEKVKPLIPLAPSHAKGGQPRMNDRQAFTAIMYVLRTGIQWNALPRELGASSTVHDRFQEWEQAGFFKAIWHAGLSAYNDGVGIQWEWQAVVKGITTKVGRIAEQATLGGYHLTRFWLPVILHQLKHYGPDRVIVHLERLERRWPLPTIGEALRYFHKRRTQMSYPQFQAQGWPIGSGMVENANKVVMQARLKGAGMHWEPTHVNPMLAVRGVICNDRWEEMWQQQQ